MDIIEVVKLIDKNTNKKWIKPINFATSTKYDDYAQRDKFIHVANVNLSINKSNEYKICFTPCITNTEYVKKCEYIYLFTIDNYIVKIGGTRCGIKQRIASYLCGHHTLERGKSGSCSKTNAVIYNSFEFYLNQGCHIKMYGYKLPKRFIEIKVLDDNGDEDVKKSYVQTYHIYESIMLDNFKKIYKMIPKLNVNYDPEYKT